MKKKWLKILFVFLIGFSIVSCSQASVPNENNGGMNQPDENPNNQVVISTGRKIIYTVSYNFSTEDLSTSIQQIQEKVMEYEGYIASGRQYSNSATYVYKIPTNALNSFLDYIDQLKGSGNKQISSEDITSTYVKLEARISTLQASKLAYDRLLENENLTMNEIITINKEIENIMTELTELYTLKDQYDESLDYSSVTIYYSNMEGKTENSFFQEYGQYLKNLGLAIVTFLLYTAPFLLLSGLIILCVYFYRKHHAKIIQQKNK